VNRIASGMVVLLLCALVGCGSPLVIGTRSFDSGIEFDLSPGVLRSSSSTVRGLTVREFQDGKPGEHLCKILLPVDRPSVPLRVWRYGEVPPGFEAPFPCARLEKGKRYLFTVLGPAVYSFKEFTVP